MRQPNTSTLRSHRRSDRSSQFQHKRALNRHGGTSGGSSVRRKFSQRARSRPIFSISTLFRLNCYASPVIIQSRLRSIIIMARLQ